MKQRSEDNRDRICHAIRREKIDKLLKQRRKLYLPSQVKPGQLNELHEMLRTNQMKNLNLFLQLLTDELHKDILPDQWSLLFDFLRFVLEELEQTHEQCDNRLLLLSTISLVCYELPHVEPFTQKILRLTNKLIFTGDQATRLQCLLILTNMSASDNETVIEEIYQSESLDSVIRLLEEFPVTNPEKDHIIGFFSNLLLHPRDKLFESLVILDSVSTELTESNLIKQLVKTCLFSFDAFRGEELMACPQFQTTIMNLLRIYQEVQRPHAACYKLFRRAFENAVQLVKQQLIENGLTMVVFEGLEHPKAQMRKEAIGLLFVCFSIDSIDYLTAFEEMAKYVTLLAKIFYEEPSLQFVVLQTLNRAARHSRIMAEIISNDDQFQQMLEEYSPDQDTDSDVVYNLLELLSILLKEEPLECLRRSTHRICLVTHGSSNPTLAQLSESLLELTDSSRSNLQ